MDISANDDAALAARDLKHGALLRPISNVVYSMRRTRNEQELIYWWTSPRSASSTP